MRPFLGLLLYIGSITVFFGTAAIGIVFCNVLLRRDIKQPPYICLSNDNIDIVALLKPATINTSSCADAIAAIERNHHNMLTVAAVCMITAIGILSAKLLLVIVVGWTLTIDL